MNNTVALISGPFTARIALLPKFLMQDWSSVSIGLFIMDFIYVVPLLDSPPCPRMSLSFRLCFVTLRCSLLSSGKIILTLSNPARLIGDRGRMNKGSKERFFSPCCQVIFTLGPRGAAQCHTTITRSGLLSICGTWPVAFGAIIEAKSFSSHVFKVEQVQKSLPTKNL